MPAAAAVGAARTCCAASAFDASGPPACQPLVLRAVSLLLLLPCCCWSRRVRGSVFDDGAASCSRAGSGCAASVCAAKEEATAAPSCPCGAPLPLGSVLLIDEAPDRPFGCDPALLGCCARWLDCPSCSYSSSRSAGSAVPARQHLKSFLKALGGFLLPCEGPLPDFIAASAFRATALRGRGVRGVSEQIDQERSHRDAGRLYVCELLRSWYVTGVATVKGTSRNAGVQQETRSHMHRKWSAEERLG